MKGFALYKARPDKGYSLTDCVSKTIMRQRKIILMLNGGRERKVFDS